MIGIYELVERVEARLRNYAECSWLDESGYECNSAAVILLLPNGDESRCIKHLAKGPQA